MARWEITRRAGDSDAEVHYHNLQTGRRWPCGHVAADVGDWEICDWVLSHGKPDLGDELVLSDGSVLQVVAHDRVLLREARLAGGTVVRPGDAAA